jgi:broad specificity phosphatase PhoE
VEATRFYLIRHASFEGIDLRVQGIPPGPPLNDLGLQQARRLAERLQDSEIEKIYSSPFLRTQETAACLAEKLNQEIEVREALREINVGDWMGIDFTKLNSDSGWQRWCRQRSFQISPGGETFLEIQARVIRELEDIRRECPGKKVAVVSHGDVIRAALAHFLATPADLQSRIEIDPASVSQVELSPNFAKVIKINEGVHL